VIIADECGVVVLDRADAEAAADRAIAVQDAEVKTRARLDAGEKLPDISGATRVLEEALRQTARPLTRNATGIALSKQAEHGT
jgi:4-hydroxy-4-methyl-2-oxoglutarate aldolase